MKLYYTLLAGFVLLSSSVYSQERRPMMLKSKNPIICYADPAEHHTHVAPPKAFQDWKSLGNARAKTANIEVEYIGFSEEAETAFQHAVDIWASLIQSNVTIRVQANWTQLGQGVLGSAIWGTVHRDFPGAQRVNTWYPAALAEKMANRELNDVTQPDIYANFNSDFNWHLGITGEPASGQYDLITVVLHELGHGLGFVDSYSASNNIGYVGVSDTGLPIIYDQQLENEAGQNLYREFFTETSELEAELTSRGLFINSPSVIATHGQRAKIYAPSTFDGGSSIAHLDEATYAAGDTNSLMSPQVAAREVNHNPGPITLAMFSDMGWEFTRIEHEVLTDIESTTGPFIITAVITSDKGPVKDVKLTYNTGGEDVTVDMEPTGDANEFEAEIPSTGVSTVYRYFISVDDNLERNYTHPGKFMEPGNPNIVQTYHTFEAGPDTKAPIITHAPRSFVQASEETFIIEAVIKDNLGLSETYVEYGINGDHGQVAELESTEGDSVYAASIDLSAVAIGDTIEYRIVAIDAATNPNTTTSPVEGYYAVSVVGLAETLDSYTNNFNEGSGDFFGDGFSIITPDGFEDGAIHSMHPYLEGSGFPNNEVNFSYQLKYPIRVDDENTLISFDEVVLIEPGEQGSTFPSEDFYDYVVVEGSLDGGLTWTPIDDGYDSRDFSKWLNRYNSAFDGNNSTAAGTAEFFRSRNIDLSNIFEEGDEVAIRFRLFSDQLAVGWGWAIDNLRIQIDEILPHILHNHHDMVSAAQDTMAIRTKVSDASGIKALRVEYRFNGSDIDTLEYPVVPNAEEYTLNIMLNGVESGDTILYRIVATDSVGNAGMMPGTGYFKTPYIAFGEPIESYTSDFDEENHDFAGNFFEINQPTGFNSGLMSTVHPYPVGFGVDTTSSFTSTLVHPIIVNAGNPFITFEEVVVVEGHDDNAEFGTLEFTDYVVVEGSADEGVTWKPLIEGYDAMELNSWKTAANTGAAGTRTMFRDRVIDITETGHFTDGDEMILRFKLFSDKTVNAWGWAIDNLSVQGNATVATEKDVEKAISIYPNPVANQFTIDVANAKAEFSVEVLNGQGRIVHQIEKANKAITIDARHFDNGLYLVKISSNGGTYLKKVIKASR